MPIPDRLPSEVALALREIDPDFGSSSVLAPSDNGTGAADPLVFEADLDPAGRFGKEWLVVHNGSVYVFSPNGGGKADLRRSLPISEIEDARAESYVGNGQLQVKLDGESMPLVRFSQASVGQAIRIARAISALAKGEPIPDETEDDSKLRCTRCGRVLPEDSDSCPACLNKRAVLVRLFGFLRPYKLQVYGGLLVLLGVTLTDLVPPYVGGRIVDAIQMSVSGRQTPDDAMRLIVLFVLILFLMRVIASAFQYAQRRLASWIGARTLMDIRIELFHHFNRLSLGYYDKRSTGSVMARVTNDADNLWDFLMDGVPWFVQNFLALGLTGVMLFRMDAKLSFILLAPAPFIYVLTVWLRPIAARGSGWSGTGLARCTRH